jgi:hypothetical protein
MSEDEQKRRATALLEAKQRNRVQLEAVTKQFDALQTKRDRLAQEVEQLQIEVERETQKRSTVGSGASDSSSSPSKKSWGGLPTEQGEADGAEGLTMTDEQIADALSNLLEFSPSRSNIRSAEK